MSSLRKHGQSAFIVILAAIVWFSPYVITDRFLMKVLTFAGMNALVAVGLALVVGYTGQVSMGHAAFMGIGAYASAYLVTRIGVSWPLAFLAAGSLAALVGLVLAVPSLKLKGHYLAMATLGFGELMSLAFVEAAPVTGGVDGFSGIPFPSIGVIVFNQPSRLYWLVWGCVGIALLGLASLTRRAPGRAMRAVHDSESGAVASGVDVTGVKVRSFTLSAAIAGLAGALYASVVGFISPGVFAGSVSVLLLAMTVLGGTRSLAGPLAAAVVMTLLQYIDALIPGMSRGAVSVVQSLQTDIYAVAIIVVIVFAPAGLAGIVRTARGKGAR